MRFSVRYLLTALAFLPCWQPSVSLAAEPSEQALKAAFLYNFARYTAWPSLDNDFQLCILGEDKLGNAMIPISRKEIAGRPIKVIHLKPENTLTDCNLLFIAASEFSRMPEIARSLTGQPVLTVASLGNYDPKLVMLRMHFDNGSLVFEANTTAAKAAGLNFSAKMLHLARKIY